ncbi:MAG: hypothetical protein GY788_21205 [bacterium]|nr:hypothetical protein [bacterium]
MNRITITSRMEGTAPADWTPGTVAYKVTLRYQRRQLTVPFYQGPGICSDPNAASVVDCLISDASALDQSFEDWADDYGYDTDSRKAELLYRKYRKYGGGIVRLLGDDYEDACYGGEDWLDAHTFSE